MRVATTHDQRAKFNIKMEDLSVIKHSQPELFLRTVSINLYQMSLCKDCISGTIDLSLTLSHSIGV